MKKIINGTGGNRAKVDTDGELHVCLCKNCCEGTIRLEDLQKAYPNLKISIRKEQLK